MDFKKNENEKYKKLDARYLAFLMGKIDGLYDKFARQYGLNYNSLGVGYLYQSALHSEGNMSEMGAF